MNISLFRIIRTVECAPEKEVIKEFLRFIGCMVSDHPVLDRDDTVKRKIEENREEAVDLYLLDKEVEECREGFIVKEMESAGNGWAFQVNIKKFRKERKQEFEEERVPVGYNLLIKEIIDAVWPKNGQENIKGKNGELKTIADVFFTKNLFGLFQCKRSFRIINMVEVYGPRFRFGEEKRRIDVGNPENLTTKYINGMLERFGDAYKELCNIKNPGIYACYAKVNMARKIREVCSQLENAPKTMFRDVVEAKMLLSELDDLYKLDPKYMGTLFLAAAVCKSDSALYLTSANYFRLLLDLIEGQSGAFYSFAYYEYGRQLERVFRDWDSAILFYKKAVSLNLLNYQAYFKLGCYEAYKGRYQEAIECFQILHSIIINNYAKSGKADISYKNLSLKIIQYLYKTDIWLWILNKDRGYNISADMDRQRAQFDAEQYKENECIREIYGDESDTWKELQEYHKQSLPVKIMKEVVR
ncbi:MAG: hypothetical protein HFF90_07715 [Oscillibacter sp.]|nr:hypothetical protein [Oscillibacter sp.]